MDVPSSPRRLPPRNPMHQSQSSSPQKHINEIFPLAPPLPLHTRSNNESWDPQPSSEEFVTPSSSPSKGNSTLVEVFDRSLQLTPSSSPTKPQATPSKRMLQAIDEDGNGGSAGVRMDDERLSRKHNKENAPPFSKATEVSQRGNAGSGLQRSHAQSRRAYDPFRDMTIDEIEKLSKPQVKRLKDVAHLYFYDYYYNLVTYVHTRRKRTEDWQAQHEHLSAEEIKPEWSRFAGRERVALRKRRTRLRKGDFQVLTQVGQGGYGQVFLAEHKETREVCALKVMSKKLLFKLDEIRHVLTERDILTAAKSDWLVKLLYAFQDDDSIYLAMEYVPGGDFRTLLNNTGVLHFNHARFYIAEMFASVNALHDLGYIHRDLKPENFLIDSSGHIKLTDFGLSAGKLSPDRMESMKMRLDQVKDMDIPERSTMERRRAYKTLRETDVNYAKSVVGSPDYMAPEVLRGTEEYDFTVDYWSLGCMLYEALAGYPPFAGATVQETWHNLKHWKKVLHKPEYENPNYYLSKRTWDLIIHLVAARDQRFRDFKSVQSHGYFSEVNWSDLRAKEPPFVPELDSDRDAGYFDDFSNEADMAKYKEVHDKQTALENMEERKDSMSKIAFVGFTFKHKKPNLDGLGVYNNKGDGQFGTIF
ncbi:kinase-like protein [Tuber magnatum]|uniref:non-specific serine/threonine protein kinase n=1 Tax=Tuber magnatum TaxID=42249 RepID=A0A317SVP6_9PEZI|nr:kinase-like protein [Tuber magnatum]